MPIIWNYTTDKDKYRQIYRLQYLLMLEFNKKQDQYKQGLISKQDLDNYIRSYEKKDALISAELLNLRDKIKKDASINTTLNDVVVI